MTGTRRAIIAAVLALAMVVLAAGPAAAQTDEEFDKIFPFLGQWDPQISGPDGQDRGNCGGRLGDNSEKLVNCTMPVARLPLNSRGEAWLRYQDQLQSPTQADCAQIAFPVVLAETLFISAYPGRLITEHPSNPWHLTRTVWMNGPGPQPLPGELFQHGLSRGRFDGNDLVIESSHFTFDPDGIEDHLHVASSVRKRVTERYRLIDDNNMRLIITLEDPTFLTKPFTYAFIFIKAGSNGPRQGWRQCDAESARREQEFAYPAKKYSTRGSAVMRRDAMTRFLVPFCGAVLVAGSLVTDVNAQSAAAKVHVNAARAALDPPTANPNAPYRSFKALFDQVCTEPKLPDAMRTNDRSAVVPRKEWFTWPVEIFDNLHFIGTKTAGVWAISSSEGIIIVDANFHYSSKELVLGLLNFGLDPNDIKYIIVTHAHDDRYWGAKALQDTYPKARVAMSAADWDIVAKDNSPAQFKPRKDMVVTDGQKITLGAVTVTLYVTPGHTPGTLSMIIEPLINTKSVASDDERHVASIWGGTDPSIGREGVQYYPDGQTMMKAHVASLRRFIDLGTKAGVDVILSPTLSHANMVEKMRYWRMANPDHSAGAEDGNRLAGEAHPFVSKEAVSRYYQVLLRCYEAQLAWRTGS